MLRKKCPGADSFLKPHPEFIECPHCKKEVEIWSDEGEAKCSSCKKTVKRPGFQSCLDWCKFAAECVGEEKYSQYLKEKARKDDKGAGDRGKPPKRRK